MTRRRVERFTVYTSAGRGSYRSRSKAIAAAQWVALESGEPVVVHNETNGHRWDVSSRGHVSLP